MQTQYQLLYRYINETTNTAITDEYDYTETKEFFNPEHKLYFTTAQLKDIGTSGNGKKASSLQFKFDNPTSTLQDEAAEEYVASLVGEAEGERESIILGEMANANKSNNFYIYNGTTKEYHKKFMPETVGYLVANLAGVPQKQIPTSPDDYSKHFVMLGGTKLGVDAFLVCKSEYISAYNQEYEELNTKKEQLILTGEKFANNLIFDWYNPQDDNYKVEYNVEPAEITTVDKDTVNAIFGGNRIINIDGENYLITSAKEIICTSVMKGSYYDGHTTTYYHSYTGQTGEFNYTQYGTIFFNCGNKLPKEVSFATIDNSTMLKASDILVTAPDSTDVKDIEQAYSDYARTLDTIQRYSCNTNTPYNGKTLPAARPASPSSINIFTGWKLSDLEEANMGNYILKLKVTNGVKNPESPKNLTRHLIPAHYEPTGQAPYIIKDNYKKIPLSPWILHSIHNSLESGLNRAKELVSMVGINNVKLIKTVPFNQFIKIK